MNYMTKSEYADYRLRVLAKANGRGIHFINGALGRVLNHNSNANYWKSRNEEKAKEQLKQRDRAMGEITKALRILNKPNTRDYLRETNEG